MRNERKDHTKRKCNERRKRGKKSERKRTEERLRTQPFLRNHRESITASRKTLTCLRYFTSDSIRFCYDQFYKTSGTRVECGPPVRFVCHMGGTLPFHNIGVNGILLVNISRRNSSLTFHEKSVLNSSWFFSRLPTTRKQLRRVQKQYGSNMLHAIDTNQWTFRGRSCSNTVALKTSFDYMQKK